MNFKQIVCTMGYKLGDRLAGSLFATAANKFQEEMNKIHASSWENITLKTTDDFLNIYLNIRQKLRSAGKELKCGIALYDEPINDEIHEALIMLRKLIMRDFPMVRLPFLM